MAIDLNTLTYEELLELNHQIVARLKALDAMHAHVEMLSFNLGARVSFDSPQGRQLGQVVKYNRKTVTVITEDGRRWNVSPHLLSAVTDVKSDQSTTEVTHTRRK